MENKDIIIYLILIALLVIGVFTMIHSTRIAKELCESKGFYYLGNGNGGWSYCGEEDERGIIVKRYRIKNGGLELYQG